MQPLHDHKRSWISRAFQLSLLEQKRIDWIDYLRGIAIILVVYHHVRVGIERSAITVPSFLVQINMIFYSFRMPLFFILSGIFIQKLLNKHQFSEIVGKKFNLLIYPYIIWAFMQVSLQIVMGEFTNANRGLQDYTYIFYHPRNLDQFWYLPALFNASMVFLLLKEKLKLKPALHFVVALVFYFASPFCEQVSMLSDWMEFYIFFVMGHLASKLFFDPASQRLLSQPRTFLLLLPVFVLVQLYYLTFNIGEKTLGQGIDPNYWDYLGRSLNQAQFFFIALIGCTTMTAAAFCLQRWGKLRFLRVIGAHSLYIYVMHVMVIGFIRLMGIHVLGISNPLALLLMGIFFGVLAPVVVYNLAIREGFAWFLFYSTRPMRKKQSSAAEVQQTTTVINAAPAPLSFSNTSAKS
jgi:fucose 4-O-acetylase-like acetyltransferase